MEAEYNLVKFLFNESNKPYETYFEKCKQVSQAWLAEQCEEASCGSIL